MSTRRLASIVLGGAALAGCGDRAVETELATARGALNNAVISARLAEIRVSAELYLDVPGDVADLQAEIALLHRLLEVGTRARAIAALERQVKEVEAQLARARLELERDGGEAAVVGTPRMAATAEGREHAVWWRRAAGVGGVRADALIPKLRDLSESDAPSHLQVRAVLQGLAGTRRVVAEAFGAAEGDVGNATHQQFRSLETKLRDALAGTELVPGSAEPLPPGVAGDLRAACSAAIGAVKFWRGFSVDSLPRTQLDDRLSAALRARSGWLAIAAGEARPDEETAERVAELLGLVGVLHDFDTTPLEGFEGWMSEVNNRGLTPVRVRAVYARLLAWFPQDD